MVYVLSKGILMLTKAKSPQSLLEYLIKNIKYKGEVKRYLYTAEEVVKNKKGHCWETAELIYKELSSLGYECYLLYIEDDKEEKITHTTVFYKLNNLYYNFELCLFGNSNISSSFKNLVDCALHIENICKLNLGKLNFNIKIGYSPILKNTTQLDYLKNVFTWKDYSEKSIKNLSFKTWSNN